MLKLFCFSLLLFWQIPEQYSYKLKDYCKYNTQNTPCRTECYRVVGCGQTEDAYESLTEELREYAVSLHNKFRQEVSEGKYSSNKLPGVDGAMYAFSYDKELEFLVGCHLKACVRAHDAYRLTVMGDPAGQNLFWSSGNPGKKGLLEGATSAWSNERSNWKHKEWLTKFPGVPKTGHLSAMIWAQTRYVGCAIFHSMKGKNDHSYAVGCNYKPVGNVMGAVVYSSTSCKGTKNSQYNKLCGAIRPLSEDKYIPPMNLDGANVLHVCPFGVYILGTLIHFWTGPSP